jgi:hypothetical protein
MKQKQVLIGYTYIRIHVHETCAVNCLTHFQKISRHFTLNYPGTSPWTIQAHHLELSRHITLNYPGTSPWTIQALHLEISRHITVNYPGTSPWTIQALHLELSRHFTFKYPGTSPWTIQALHLELSRHFTLSYSTLHTPCSKVLEKLTDSQLVKKFPALYGTRKFITAFTRAHHLSHIFLQLVKFHQISSFSKTSVHYGKRYNSQINCFTTRDYQYILI